MYVVSIYVHLSFFFLFYILEDSSIFHNCNCGKGEFSVFTFCVLLFTVRPALWTGGTSTWLKNLCHLARFILWKYQSSYRAENQASTHYGWFMHNASVHWPSHSDYVQRLYPQCSTQSSPQGYIWYSDPFHTFRFTCMGRFWKLLGSSFNVVMGRHTSVPMSTRCTCMTNTTLTCFADWTHFVATDYICITRTSASELGFQT